VPLTTFPSFARASSAVRARMTTSAGSPRDRRFGIDVGAAPIEAPLTVVTLWPVDRSHSATSVLHAAVKPLDTITCSSSSAARGVTEFDVSANNPQRRRCFTVFVPTVVERRRAVQCKVLLEGFDGA
jgi:hypothetical protein